MIRLLLPFTWHDQEATEDWVESGRRCIAELVDNYPGYYAAEIEPNYSSDQIWLILKPTEDYEMDEGL